MVTIETIIPQDVVGVKLFFPYTVPDAKPKVTTSLDNNLVSFVALTPCGR
jgi:hypothetical protein